MKTRSGNLSLKASLQWETRVPAFNVRSWVSDGQLMIVKGEVRKGAVGTMHAHYHSQATYVASGKFELTIGDEKRRSSGPATATMCGSGRSTVASASNPVS